MRFRLFYTLNREQFPPQTIREARRIATLLERIKGNKEAMDYIKKDLEYYEPDQQIPERITHLVNDLKEYAEKPTA